MAESQLFVPVSSNTLVEKKLAAEESHRDPFSEDDYKSLLAALDGNKKTAVMAGHVMLIRPQAKGKYVSIKRKDGVFTPSGSIEVERLRRIYGSDS